MNQFKLTILLILVLYSFPNAINSETPVPKLHRRVTDLTRTLSSGQKYALEKKLALFEKQKGSQIAVLMINSTRNEPIEDYSMRVVEKWKLGRKGIDDGVLLLIAKKDRKLRIEVGYGLEGALNDATAKRVIDNIIVPEFKKRRFYNGINSGIDLLIKIILKEPLPENFSTSSIPDINWDPHNLTQRSDFIAVLVFAGVGLLLFSIGVIALYSKTNATGIIGTIFVLAFLVSTYFYLMFFFVLWFVIGMIFMFICLGITSAGSWSSGGSGGGWSSSSGSSGGWSSSSSSSSSSFSGGGGSFGGGGASGSW